MWKHLFALVSVAVIITTVAANVSAAPALDKPRTFSLLEVQRTFSELGRWESDAPRGGDQFTTTSTLFRWNGQSRKGARVGRSPVLLTFLSGYGPNATHRATALVTAQVYLPDGTLLIEGYATFRPGALPKMKLPVIGGTGVYDNARGQVFARQIPQAGRARLDFHLVP